MEITQVHTPENTPGRPDFKINIEPTLWSRRRGVDDIFHVNPYGEIFVNEQSPIFDSHFWWKFPIVPWVLLSELFRDRLGWLWAVWSIYTEFLQPIRPGAQLKLRDDGGKFTIMSQIAPIEWKEVAYMSSSTARKPQFTDFSFHNTNVDDWVDWAEWVPHGDNFRFVDIVGWSDHNGTYVYQWKYFPKESDFQDGKIPFWLLEECGAQCILWAKRALDCKNSSYSTYKSSLIQPVWDMIGNIQKINDSSEIRVMWTVKEDARTATTHYTLFADDMPIFHAIIEWNIISSRAWDRIIWMPTA